MLVKSKIMDSLIQVDTEDEGQIWVVLSCLPTLKLGGIYIPPSDSPYYSPAQYGALVRHMTDRDRVIALGDFNARVATPQLSDRDGNYYQYRGVQDNVVNEHGRTLLNICNNNGLAVANHLHRNGKLLGGDLSFRRRERWLSEIDLCVIKNECVDMITNLHMDQTVPRSDHAPLCVTVTIAARQAASSTELLRRASALGKPRCAEKIQPSLPKSIQYKDVDLGALTRELQVTPTPVLTENSEVHEVEAAVTEGCRIIRAAAAAAAAVPTTRVTNRQRQVAANNNWVSMEPRWKRILETNDTKMIWKSINWKGNVDQNKGDRPNDAQFKEHFEKLLNTENARTSFSCDISTAPYIPILDDPFTYEELSHVNCDINVNKSYCGMCPGVFRMLPASWLMFFLTIFNIILMKVLYPQVWCYSKLTVLFKSGNKMLCGNYRGICIMDTLAKIFDTLILNRLKLWFNIDKCQAGAQKGRGCLEHVISLRLLCDYANYKKNKLYVLFIDFSKAYDRVPRNKLVKRLKELGCGKVMLYIIKAMYTCTKNILKSAIIDTTVGVRQGAPTSSLLFVIYIDKMVQMLKRAVERDGFLGSLHVLLLMDDAVVLATSRKMCLKKLASVSEFCKESGMLINEKKTKFFVINGDENDRQSLNSGGVQVQYCNQYLYLGAWFTDAAHTNTVTALHHTASEAIVNKFAIFCASNTLMPFVYKKKVFDAAVTSALLYSCESWFSNNLKSVEKQYNKLIKCLMGVRKNTSVNLCMIEAGINPLNKLVADRRYKFITLADQMDRDIPFHYIYNLCREENTPGYRFLEQVRSRNRNPDELDHVKQTVREKAPGATKLTTYITYMNPSLTVHPIYSTTQYVPDYKREAFTRLRLMSHSLRIEVGRWSRTPRDQRVCPCDGTHIQTEEHALLHCPLSAQHRNDHPHITYDTLQAMFTDNTHLEEVCDYVYAVLKFYKNYS